VKTELVILIINNNRYVSFSPILIVLLVVVVDVLNSVDAAELEFAVDSRNYR
jgi:hypothetical protein